MKKTGIFLLCTLAFLVSCQNDSLPESQNSPQQNSISEESQKNENAADAPPYKECMQGCFMMWEQNPNNKDKKQDEKQKNCDDLCNASQGIEENNLESCEKSGDPLLQSGCFAEVAKSLGDVTICDKISENLLKDTCIMGVAEKTKNPDLCDKIQEELMKTGCEEESK